MQVQGSTAFQGTSAGSWIRGEGVRILIGAHRGYSTKALGPTNGFSLELCVHSLETASEW